MLRATKCGLYLECVAVCNSHNHELSEHSASMLFQNRKLPADFKMIVMQLSTMHVERKRIIDYVYRKTGKVLTGKDLQNFRQAAISLLQSSKPPVFVMTDDDLLSDLNEVCGPTVEPVKFEVVEYDYCGGEHDEVAMIPATAEEIMDTDEAYGFDEEYIQDDGYCDEQAVAENEVDEHPVFNSGSDENKFELEYSADEYFDNEQIVAGKAGELCEDLPYTTERAEVEFEEVAPVVQPPSPPPTKNVHRQSQRVRRRYPPGKRAQGVACHHVCLNAKLIEARIAVLRAEEQRLIEETAVLRLTRQKLSSENINLTRSNQELRSDILSLKRADVVQK